MRQTKEERTQKLLKTAAEKLDYAVQLFVTNMKTDPTWNAELLESIHQDWKKESVRMNRMQKLIVFGTEDFKKAIGEKIIQLKGGGPKTPKDEEIMKKKLVKIKTR